MFLKGPAGYKVQYAQKNMLILRVRIIFRLSQGATFRLIQVMISFVPCLGLIPWPFSREGLMISGAGFGFQSLGLQFLGFGVEGEVQGLG